MESARGILHYAELFRLPIEFASLLVRNERARECDSFAPSMVFSKVIVLLSETLCLLKILRW